MWLMFSRGRAIWPGVGPASWVKGRKNCFLPGFYLPTNPALRTPACVLLCEVHKLASPADQRLRPISSVESRSMRMRAPMPRGHGTSPALTADQRLLSRINSDLILWSIFVQTIRSLPGGRGRPDRAPDRASHERRPGAGIHRIETSNQQGGRGRHDRAAGHQSARAQATPSRGRHPPELRHRTSKVVAGAPTALVLEDRKRRPEVGGHPANRFKNDLFKNQAAASPGQRARMAEDRTSQARSMAVPWCAVLMKQASKADGGR